MDAVSMLLIVLYVATKREGETVLGERVHCVILVYVLECSSSKPCPKYLSLSGACGHRVGATCDLPLERCKIICWEIQGVSFRVIFPCLVFLFSKD